jgi:hypothetical protein
MGGASSVNEVDSLEIARELQHEYDRLKSEGGLEEDDLLKVLREKYLVLVRETKMREKERAREMHVELGSELEEDSTLSYFGRVDRTEKSIHEPHVALPSTTKTMKPSPSISNFSEKTKAGMMSSGRKLTAKEENQLIIRLQKKSLALHALVGSASAGTLESVREAPKIITVRDRRSVNDTIQEEETPAEPIVEPLESNALSHLVSCIYFNVYLCR